MVSKKSPSGPYTDGPEILKSYRNFAIFYRIALLVRIGVVAFYADSKGHADSNKHFYR